MTGPFRLRARELYLAARACSMCDGAGFAYLTEDQDPCDTCNGSGEAPWLRRIGPRVRSLVARARRAS